MKLLLVWLINAAALFALPYIFKSIQIDTFITALIVALILSVVNTIIRPILLLLTLPITVISLGLFIFVLNGLLFWCTNWNRSIRNLNWLRLALFADDPHYTKPLFIIV